MQKTALFSAKTAQNSCYTATRYNASLTFSQDNAWERISCHLLSTYKTSFYRKRNIAIAKQIRNSFNRYGLEYRQIIGIYRRNTAIFIDDRAINETKAVNIVRISPMELLVKVCAFRVCQFLWFSKPSLVDSATNMFDRWIRKWVFVINFPFQCLYIIRKLKFSAFRIFYARIFLYLNKTKFKDTKRHNLRSKGLNSNLFGA